MTVIDLGELRDHPKPSPDRPRPRAVGRPLRTALVSLLVLATLAGAAPAPGRVAAVVPSSPVGKAFFVDDLVVVDEPVGEVTSGDRDLTAYPMPERPASPPPRAEPLWRVRVPVGGYVQWIEPHDDALLLTVNSRTETDGETIALHARTGQVRWRQPGIVRSGRTGSLFLQRMRDDGVWTLRAVDVGSGRVTWSLGDLPRSPDYRLRDGAIDRVVVFGPGDEVEVRDPANGAVLARAGLRPDAFAELSGLVVGDLVVLIDDQTVTAYDLDRLERRWVVPLPAVEFVGPCGEVLCTWVRDGGLQALDPATGALRWRTSGWDAVMETRSGHLLVVTFRDGRGWYGVLDAGTGGQIADLGDWSMLAAVEPDGPLVGIRPGRGGRLTPYELDLADVRLRALDAIPSASELCQAGPDGMMCRRPDGSFGVWRWPA
ncbi:PQQ-binding-like beta-propeller repeat protein [Micromonospora costi]|uniref:outer membrane protein assembly factor BamB family protein n=1 Tax=Micromonospora costi TaxID=1530042 RepID=UPI0033E48B5B